MQQPECDNSVSGEGGGWGGGEDMCLIFLIDENPKLPATKPEWNVDELKKS